MVLRARRQHRPQRLLRDQWGGSYLPMVILLVLLLLVGPSLSDRGAASTAFVSMIELGIILLGVLGATANPTQVRVIILVTIVAALAQATGERTSIGFLEFLGGIVIIGVLFRVQSLILRDIVPEPSVTVSTIVGAVGTYLLSVVYWATIYALLSVVKANSFQGTIGTSHSTLNFLYFSAITQTTVGFGDIVPITSFARSLASLQAISGQLYVAILVAWLVGRAVSERSK